MNQSRQLRLLTLSLLRRQRSLLLSLLNLGDDRLLQRLGLSDASPASDDLPVRGDEELLKVPLDALEAHQARLLLLHPGPQGRRLFAVHVELAQHGEGDAVVDLAEGLDVVVGARVLAAELVAGEAEDGEVLRVLLLDGLVEGFEALKLRGEAAFGGGVDDEDDLAFEGGEREGGALF